MTEPKISQQAGFDKIEDDLQQFLNSSYTPHGNRLIVDRSKWDELLAYISIKFFKAWMSGWHQGTQDEKSRLLLFLEHEKIELSEQVPSMVEININHVIDFVRNKE